MRRVFKIFKIFAVLALLGGVGAWNVTSATAGPGRVEVPIGELKPAEQFSAGAPIRVMTVNLAHGRSNGFHQALRTTATIKTNLEAVGALIERERIDVVGVQEADGPSFWSGRFDHVEYVAQHAQSAQHLRGEHVKGFKLSYGTGLISRLDLSNPLSRAFDPSPPTFTKGFVVATLTHPDVPGGIDVASVHLDFARSSVRTKQITTLIETLKARGRPLIVMGDFNTEYSADGPIGRMMQELDLKAHSPENGEKTFKFTNKRLDWILIPKDWQFVEHVVLPDVVSDHQPVRVTIAVR